MPRYAVEVRIHSRRLRDAYAVLAMAGYHVRVELEPARATDAPEVELTATIDHANGTRGRDVERHVRRLLTDESMPIYAIRHRRVQTGSLVQIEKRSGTLTRVKPGETPIIELQLAPHQQLVSVELRRSLRVDHTRKTVDWNWEAYVATRL